MGKQIYKPLYVIAGKRENGTWGLMRTLGKIVYGYTNIKEVKRERKDYKSSIYETIIVDVGAIVDPNINRTNKRIDISKIL